jgi:hypothetical protein
MANLDPVLLSMYETIFRVPFDITDCPPPSSAYSGAGWPSMRTEAE